jgi:hypothetical protein
MELTGLHLLLTYQCNFECDHCFVWGSPWQSGTMTLEKIRTILKQADELGTIEWIYFEGGEPFLYYVLLKRGVELAAEMGFKVGIVSNSYWATSVEDAREWLKPFADLVEDLSISSDFYHWSELISRQARNARSAAEQLGIPLGYIQVRQPEPMGTEEGGSTVMFRGRAVSTLVDKAPHRPWRQFTSCPYEDLRDPGRVHLDPLGNLQICQGISLGNVFEKSLAEIWQEFDPDANPITGPLLAGGPVELVSKYKLPHLAGYADACHLCYEARLALRHRFPSILSPDQTYGIFDGASDVYVPLGERESD